MRRSPAALALCCILLAGCSSAPGHTSRELADQQTLRIAIPEDIGVFEPFDPAQLSSALDFSVGQNLFDGLVRMNDQLQVAPDLALAMPNLSANGLTYTFTLRPNAAFSNGDPVTASDVVYSWNRALDAGGPYASASQYATIFQPIVGYQAVEDGLSRGTPPPQLAGLLAPDPHTVVIKLSRRVGSYFLVQLTLPAAWIVDPRVIRTYGEQSWWQSPATLVGTGPFVMVSHTPGVSVTLAPVAHWWGGSTGLLKKVMLDVVPDAGARLSGYQQSHFDVVGLGDYGPDAPGTQLAAVLRRDPAHLHEVHKFLYGRSEWIGFNVASGPFGGADGRLGRLALSLAIDRTRLARAVCGAGTLCVPATGGLISKGLQGYLDEGSDRTLQFDPASARADLAAWDPTGSRRRGLTYVYLANSLYRAIADNLREQWRQNLGVEIQLQGYDTHTFLYDRVFGSYAMFRGSWGADYNSPQDWYDNLFVGPGAASGSGYASPSFDATINQADASSGSAADLAYQQADRMLLEEAVIDPILYYVHTIVVKPYVVGLGANALYEYRWTEVEILNH